MSEQRGTITLTVGQAVVRYLAAQWTERDERQRRLFAGCFGIFGHGNVAGLGQALAESDALAGPVPTYEDGAPAGDTSGLTAKITGTQVPVPEVPLGIRYYQSRNEQAMVHTAAGYARASNRLSTFACTSSIGPGATNMVTGAALATINRLPVLLLPGDTFATRPANPVLQELEAPYSMDVSVNDSFRPVSRYFDRINRPEQLPSALLAATRVLTDPAETGAVTLALPQDVQAEAHAFPVELFDRRVWHIGRPVPEPAALERAVALIRSARRPLIVSGGGTIYAEATEALAAFAAATGIPVAETQAGKGSLHYRHPQSVGAIGHTGTTAANRLAREADVVIGIGTRWSDFTTASRSLFAYPGVRFVNINIASFDAAKLSGVALTADARAALDALAPRLADWSVEPAYRELTGRLAGEWDAVVERAYHLGHTPRPAQSEVIGAVNDAAGPRGVVVCAAGSMPGDLHKLWRTESPGGYHVEYGYSCMGYEIAGGVGVKMADPEREVYVLVGDGSYLMMAQELVTAVQENIKITVVLVQNHGYASIGGLSQSVGALGFATQYRYRTPTGRLDGGVLPVDLAANAASLGATVLRAHSAAELRTALAEARAVDGPALIHVETDPSVPAPAADAWWDVPVAETSALAATRDARADYDKAKQTQRPHLAPSAEPAPENEGRTR
ncbi:3D-(3,5/4)-trihydroxycyclohexane-1,2-dione acylhydrolase (decyclizing) [Allonocardiopsis opalescens]|uniref:3D-(3,5/4)-trihydroxycyclohexane-1,2-dione hydrolase n=1 Tax=Allonocardiopsis opalescens TaxID=1144618 RepID=A0A2T0PV67_9ACTN|nr:3D-(3,5/4)-trihydroxycyclohexane-1,2-dione acylhydrolase (decyclizing) [Allonocardiopsis opalescens]PRX95423.1 3D-(3,5/4)-trihydroxycyclohexane-1,2-dione hydrolase [Allonocardiopsis opalescens]